MSLKSRVSEIGWLLDIPERGTQKQAKHSFQLKILFPFN